MKRGEEYTDSYDYEDENGNEEEEPKASPMSQSFYSWLQAVVPVMIVVILGFTFLGRLTPVDGDSMYPTLHSGDLMLVQRIGYTPKQGDVVVLTKEFDQVTGPIVKRVVAVGGQSVEIDYGESVIYVDGQPLEEDYINGPMEQKFWQTTRTLTVPEGELFVVGDNRNVSNDSRNPSLGTVDARYVLGRATLVIFPLHRLRGIL